MSCKESKNSTSNYLVEVYDRKEETPSAILIFSLVW
jgi:hypothetical protein